MLADATIQRTLATALRTGGDFAEVFVEDKRSSSAMLDDGRVEELSSGRDRGAGIRVVVGETTGFAHTADLSDEGLRAAAEAAAAAARSGGGGVREVALTRQDAPRPNEVAILPETVAKGAKVDLLRRADEAARAEGGSIRQVRARYGDSRRQILVANSEGLVAGDDQVRTLFVVSAVASGDTGMQTGYESVGRTVGFELFDRYEVDEIARTAARRAITKLAARPAPSGTLPVVIGPGGGGVLFHEACGHGLEKDLVDKGASVFKGRLGEQVASPLVTLVDDGTMAEEWGCFAIDDEGTPAQRNVLIEDGVLTDYMWDMLRSRKDGRARTGNGRRQSYQHLPMVRMTNTYLLGGEGVPRRHRGVDRPRGVRVVARRRAGQHRYRRLRVRHDRGVSHRGRQDHRAAARGQPHRQRPEGAARHRRGGQRLLDGPPGHLRQGRPRRPGGRRRPHPPGQGPHDRRHRRVTAHPIEISTAGSGVLTPEPAVENRQGVW